MYENFKDHSALGREPSRVQVRLSRPLRIFFANTPYFLGEDNFFSRQIPTQVPLRAALLLSCPLPLPSFQHAVGRGVHRSLEREPPSPVERMAARLKAAAQAIVAATSATDMDESQEPIEEDFGDEGEKQDGDGGLLASPLTSRVEGLLKRYNVKDNAVFRIHAFREGGARSKAGGDAFFVAIRGASRVRARVVDQQDGTYEVTWKPLVSGPYSIAVSLFGVSLPGSPYYCHVDDPSPYAPNVRELWPLPPAAHPRAHAPAMRSSDGSASPPARRLWPQSAPHA